MTDVITTQPLIIPAGNGSTEVYYEEVNLGDSQVESITIVFPPGCAGLVGVQIQYAVNPVYPVGAGSWFVLDDYTYVIDVSNQQTGGQWRIAGYNADIYQHAIQSYWGWNYLPQSPVQSAASLISL